MKIREWYQKNKVMLWITIAITIIMVLIFVYVFMQIQYCICHPDEEWCKMTNMTG